MLRCQVDPRNFRATEKREERMAEGALYDRATAVRGTKPGKEATSLVETVLIEILRPPATFS